MENKGFVQQHKRNKHFIHSNIVLHNYIVSAIYENHDFQENKKII